MKIIESKVELIELVKKEVKSKETQLESNAFKLKQMATELQETKRMRKFYQSLLLKSIRDLKMLDGHKEEKTKFNAINETLEDLVYQKEIVTVLENIDI